MLDAKIEVPLRSRDKNEQKNLHPQDIAVRVDVPTIQLVSPTPSLKSPQLSPSLMISLMTLSSVGVFFVSCLLLFTSRRREQFRIEATRLPLFALKKAASVSLFALRRGYSTLQRRSLGLSEQKTFLVENLENNGEKEEVDILIVQPLLLFLPHEKKRRSVVVANLTSFDGLIIPGQYGKITKVWQQDQFKPWKDKKNKPLISEIVLNLAIPVSPKFEERKGQTKLFIAPLPIVRKNGYDLKAIDKLMLKGAL